MIESLILIEGQDANIESLRSLSLGNAKQVVIGNTPEGGGVILHIAAESPADLGTALLEFAQVPGVTQVLPLLLRNW